MGFESIQEIDFNDVFKGCSVYCEMILTPEQARRKTVAACHAALTKRGVAVLVVPADVANAASHDEPLYAVHDRRPVIRPSDADLDEIAAILNKSEAITIYAGAGCAGAHDEVVATAARLKAPMAHTSRGKDFLEYDNPYNVGMTGIIGGSAGYHAILDCDVLLLLGADFAWTQFYPDKAKIIQIDVDPTHIGRRHPVAVGAVGNIKATLEALLPRLAQHEDGSFLAAHVERFQKDQAAAKAETVSGPDSRISGTYLTKVINKHAAEDALFAADDGTAAVWMLRHIDTGGKRRTFASLLHGTMASGMASALGLQKCQPGRQVICLAGDGGFAMLLGDLLTTLQHDLPIKIVVYDNGKLGFVDIEQKAAGLVPVYTDLKNPDFGKVAKAMGLWGHRVSKAGELEESVKSWLAQPGPALLHVKVNPMQLVTPPSPLVAPEAVVGMAVYTARAMLQGKGHDVWEMMVENIP
jgi:pyruvate dehydrogenase (quinone)